MTVGLRGAGAVLALACVAGLAGCADKAPESPTPAPASTPAPTRATSAAPSPPGKTTAATTALPGMPTPTSVGSSPVDATRLRSTDDLASVFQCPSSPTPIRIPATPPATGATAPAAPDAVVCASALADKEAIFLWYTPTPEAKLGALTDALARARYVHAGPNWVAAGQVNPTLGSIGGEVYR